MSLGRATLFLVAPRREFVNHQTAKDDASENLETNQHADRSRVRRNVTERRRRSGAYAEVQEIPVSKAAIDYISVVDEGIVSCP